MDIALPAPIAAYFAADRARAADAVLALFAPDAAVTDERQTHVGREAIAAWIADTTAKFDYRVAPYAVSDDAGHTVVTATLTGNFPGSPVDLRYRFALDGDTISRLEIGV